MAFRVNFSPRAQQDAQAIFEWLQLQRVGEPGIRWYARLNKAIQSLSYLPTRCGLAPENPSVPFEMRELLYGHRSHVYRILFTIEEDIVHVLHIRHGKRRQLDEPH
jgi:plasmid stabilization system protein ParE